MQLHCHFIEALDRVLAWNLPDEACADALTPQAALLAGIEREHFTSAELD